MNIFTHQPTGSIRLLSLGGGGNVTKNMYVYEYRKSPGEISDILIVDCGVGFPDEAMFGIDLVIPDITYLRDKKNKIRAIVLTHGHDDHIGALAYILPEIRVPIYGSKLTAALVQVKLKEFGLGKNVHSVSTQDVLRFGPFLV